MATHLVNLIPAHLRYIEPFAGNAACARALRRAPEAVLIERDRRQARRLAVELPAHRVLCTDAIAWLEKHAPTFGPETVIYADPPYPIEDRRAGRRLYLHELTAADHDRLCRALMATKARVLVSGLPWGRYPHLYGRWHRHEFNVGLRSGRPGVECVWANFADPFPLHDYRYFGADKRRRQDLRRQVTRNLAVFRRMDRHRRAAVLGALVEEFAEVLAGVSASRAGVRT